MRNRFTRVVTDLLASDPRVAVVLADIGVAGFAPAAERHPDRVINVGIREQLMIGVAAGLSLEGLRPFVHSYTPFLVERPFEQLKLDLGHQDLGAVLVSIGASHDAAGEGRTHQSPGDVALVASLPDWHVHAPGHPDEVEQLLRREAEGRGRAYVRLAADVNRTRVRHDGTGMSVIRRGSVEAPTVIAVGPMLDRVLAATENRDVTVIYAITVRPFDHETLRSALGAADVVIVEPYLAGTSVAEVDAALLDVPHRVLGLGVGPVDLRRYGHRSEHDAAHGLDVAGLRHRIDGFVSRAAA